MAAVCEDLDEDYRCGYCLQTFSNMVDPRVLPCGHVFCFGCMDMDLTEWEGFICVRCQKFHKGVCPRSLPRARMKKQQSIKLTDPDNRVCERGLCGQSPVVLYCHQCNEKLCESHSKTHWDYFDDDHAVMSIEEYKKAPHCDECGRRYKIEPTLCRKKKHKIKDIASIDDPLPVSIAVKSEEIVETQCYSVFHRADGDILMACEDGLKLFNHNKEMSNCGHPFVKVKAVIESVDDVYVLHEKDGVYVVDILPHDLSQTRTLFECPVQEEMEATSMSMNDQLIIVHKCEQRDKGLWSRSVFVCYEFESKKSTCIPMEGGYNSILLPDGHIIVIEKHCLSKYKLEEDTLSVVWRCGELFGLDRVCVNSHGYLLVSTKKWPMSFYSVSPDGIEICELKMEKFRPYQLGQTSLRGNEIVLPAINIRHPNQSTLHFLTVSY